MRVKQVKGREMTAGLTMAAALLTGLITVPSLLFQAGMDFTNRAHNNWGHSGSLLGIRFLLYV